ncbi:MAG: bifunctional GNAT family N-acetyltransferase/carbon-nitrogen hydrolase family protein [Deltaproteobacteria bacterium]|nr:bifunctional GNAT family N-acetyltransferase/carbon-nitrogen hydrolase family protein [Deltaproteobacteria bacterium]
MNKKGVRVRRWQPEDLGAIIACQKAAWPEYPDGEQYGRRTLRLAFAAFPEGQLLAEIDGEVVGYATSVIVDLPAPLEQYSFDELTGQGTFSTHTAEGDTLYGADIAVHPDWRGQRVAAKLYQARKRLLRKHNLRRMVAFGRLPGYGALTKRMKPETYVAKVREGSLKDPALTAQLRAGYEVKAVRQGLMEDAASAGWATLIELRNPDYDPRKRRYRPRKVERLWPRARICAVQWRMSDGVDLAAFQKTASFFATVANEYGCHVLVFPELVAAPLLASLPPTSSADEMRALAGLHSAYLEVFQELAKEHHLYIVAGSHPVLRDDALFNVAHLLTPRGNVYTQDKLHLTPTERDVWGFTPGEELRVFESPFGKLAMQVCFDIEFPEPSRLLADAGVDTIFVPFSTDDEAAYLRVRFSAHARAIENVVYLALSGSCGNLARPTYLLNYSRSAVLTPSDFGFPPNAVAAEAPPHEQTVAIADLDYALLDHARAAGSVLPLRELRHDLYELEPRTRLRTFVLDDET